MAKKRESLRKKHERQGSNMVQFGIGLVVLTLGLAAGIHGRTLQQKNLDYQIREEKLEAALQEEEERKAELEEKKIYVRTKQYVEEVAKEKLGLVKPDEILLKPGN